MPTYEYPRPALTVDVVAFAGGPEARRVLLIRRGQAPFEGWWALPGGFVDEDEPLEIAARRELVEETGLAPAGSLVQVGTFGDAGRDPRGWTVSVAFGVVVDGHEPTVRGGDDASHAAWHALGALPTLAFDHDRVIVKAREVLGV